MRRFPATCLLFAAASSACHAHQLPLPDVVLDLRVGRSDATPQQEVRCTLEARWRWGKERPRWARDIVGVSDHQVDAVADPIDDLAAAMAAGWIDADELEELLEYLGAPVPMRTRKESP